MIHFLYQCAILLAGRLQSHRTQAFPPVPRADWSTLLASQKRVSNQSRLAEQKRYQSVSQREVERNLSLIFSSVFDLFLLTRRFKIETFSQSLLNAMTSMSIFNYLITPKVMYLAMNWVSLIPAQFTWPRGQPKSFMTSLLGFEQTGDVRVLKPPKEDCASKKLYPLHLKGYFWKYTLFTVLVSVKKTFWGVVGLNLLQVNRHFIFMPFISRNVILSHRMFTNDVFT